MAKITLYNGSQSTVTYVPNSFIDEYMTNANGEYVKVYLYILRCMDQKEPLFSLSQIADHFDCTERDIMRALTYWEKQKLFGLEYDENKNLSGIYLQTDSVRPAAVSMPNPISQEHPQDMTNRFIQATETPKKPEYSMDEIQSFSEKEDVQEMIFISEQYLGRTLNQNDLNMLFFWYDEFHFSAELIEFLIESCVSKGHISLHYMQRIAEDFSARGVCTVDAARQLLNQDTAIYHAVMKAFGIRGRNLVPSETSYLKNWYQKMGFSVELITEACARTMNAIHEPSFGYANSILDKWYKQNIRTMEDVQKADAVFQQQNQLQKQHSNIATGTNGTRFANFKQRDNNYEDLQRKLIQSSLKK